MPNDSSEFAKYKWEISRCYIKVTFPIEVHFYSSGLQILIWLPLLCFCVPKKYLQLRNAGKPFIGMTKKWFKQTDL